MAKETPLPVLNLSPADAQGIPPSVEWNPSTQVRGPPGGLAGRRPREPAPRPGGPRGRAEGLRGRRRDGPGLRARVEQPRGRRRSGRPPPRRPAPLQPRDQAQPFLRRRLVQKGRGPPPPGPPLEGRGVLPARPPGRPGLGGRPPQPRGPPGPPGGPPGRDGRVRPRPARQSRLRRPLGESRDRVPRVEGGRAGPPVRERGPRPPPRL